MPRLFVGNFDFEHRLACGAGSLPRRLENINADLSPAWVAIAEPGDAVWTQSPRASRVFDALANQGLPHVRAVADLSELREPHQPEFWGDNAWAFDFANTANLRWDGCDAAIVRRVNSRCFKHDLEQRLNVALDGAALSCSADELTNAVVSLRHLCGWVLKGELGGAGREVRFGSDELSNADLAWASNRFRHKLAVTVEPRLDAIEEAGLQFDVDRDGAVSLLGVTPLLSRSNGGYLGSRFVEDASLLTTWSDAIAVAQQAASLVASEGYFGPLGIDAMRYCMPDGEIRIRPLQDLNARYTMGRLALGLRRFPEFANRCKGVFRPTEFVADLTPLSDRSL